MGCYNTGLGSYQKWFIGNDIRTILLKDEDIVAKVDTNIFPLIAPENTKGDFIIYNRDKYSKSMVKMGVYEDECEVAVIAVSENYDDAVSLASLIDNALSGKHLVNDVKISIILSDSSETYDDGKYIETLVFKVK